MFISELLDLGLALRGGRGFDLVESMPCIADRRRKMSKKEELKDRVEAKKLRLQAKLRELKADTRSTSRDEAKKLQAKLDALSKSLKGGWGDLSETVAGKLNDWLKDD